MERAATHATPRQVDEDPICGSEPPLHVPVAGVPADRLQAFERCAREARCRLYAATDGRQGAFVIEGHPGDLDRLRFLLQPLRGLDFVREAVEARSGASAAAPAESAPRLTADLYRRTEVHEDVAVPAGTALLVSRDFTFDAAHNLPRYQGKCERLHGHTFRVRVTVKAPLDTWSGMAFDFHDLKKAVEGRVVRVLDHGYVNEVVPNPSAEYIAIWVWERLADLPLHEVKVWETPTCFVTYQGPPRA